MYIHKKDLELLIKLENKLGRTESWSEDTRALWELIERLITQQKKDNAKVREKVAKMRKIDKNYGRSKNIKKGETNNEN